MQYRRQPAPLNSCHFFSREIGFFSGDSHVESLISENELMKTEVAELRAEM
jgi:hypothetical protein